MISKLYLKHSLDMKDNVKIFPNIKDTILKLKEKYRLAIHSNSYSELIKEILKKNGMEDAFDYIVGADHGEKGIKPDPEFLISALNELDVQPHEVAYVGDMDGDIIMAKAVGVKTIAVTYGYHSKEKLIFHHPDHIIDKPEELLEVFK